MPTVKIRDIDMNYQEYGEGRPLLIIHGAPSNGRMFAALCEPHLKERTGWRRLYPDLLDYGDGGIPPSINSSDAVVDILIDFIEAVCPGERFTVIGGSWGGFLARSLVQRCLDRIDGVHLLAPLMDWSTAFETPEQLILRRDSEFEAALQPAEEWLRGSFAVQSIDTLDKFRADVLGNWREISQEGSAPLWNSNFVNDPDVLPFPCPAPTLIVCGRQDVAAGYQKTWSIVENFPRGTYIVLDMASHWLIYEQAALYQSLMNEWLDRVEEYIGAR